MSFGQYMAGLVGLGLIAGSSGIAALRVRRALLPHWHGGPARLAEIVVALALTLLVVEALGAVGAFHRFPVLLGVLVVGGLAAAAAPRLAAIASAVTEQPHGVDREKVTSHQPVLLAGALAIAFLTVVLWVARSLDAYDLGVFDVDSVQYHLPFAARFFQTGSLTELHFVSPDALQAFHPLNSECLHAIGMVLFRADLLSPGLNLGWLLVALLAGWVAGSRRGVAPLTMAATAVVLILALLVRTQAGTANSDVAALALLLAAVALLLHDPDHPHAVLVAAAAAGLAIGTKLTVLAPVALLSLLVVIRWRRRPPVALAWCGILVATGGFWYLRNLIRAGSPVPSLDLSIGPVGFPSPDLPIVDRTGFAIADYLFDGELWRSVFLPGIADAFGAATIPLLVIVAAGVIVGLTVPTLETRLAAAIVLVGIAAYLVTPLSAPGPEGDPDMLIFSLNVRYVLPVVPLALIAIALATTRAPPWVGGAVLALFALVAILAWREGTEIPFPPAGSQPDAVPILAGAVAAVLVLTWASGRRPVVFSGMLALVAVVIVAAGWRFADRYMELRHRHIAPADVLLWLEPLRDRRIGVSGYYNHYLLVGAELDNDVRELGSPRAHGGFERARNCRDLRSLVNHRRYEFIVLSDAYYARRSPAILGWIRSDRSTTPIVQRPNDELPIWVFRVDRPMRPQGCTASDRSPRRT